MSLSQRSASAMPNDDFDDDQPTVINRRGESEPVKFDKITDRVKALCGTAYGGRLKCNAMRLAQMVIAGWRPGITTQELDDILREKCSALSAESSDYTRLAGRVIVSNMHKNAELAGEFTFVDVTEKNSSELLTPKGKPSGRLLPAYVQFVREHAEEIEDRIDYKRDFDNNGFTIATLQRSYLLKSDSGCTELPQHAYMRVALFTSCFQKVDGEIVPVEGEIVPIRLEQAFASYNMLSKKDVSMASPFLFNAGTRHAQMSSCYLMEMDDSLASIYKLIGDSAMCSKHAGGIGMSVSRLRAEGAIIGTSGGKTSGMRMMLPVLNKSFAYANQNDRRPGSCALSIEPWHADIFLYLKMGRHDSELAREEAHAPNLKYALWIPDRFLLELEKELNGDPDAAWYLMSPDECPGLMDVYDEIGPNHSSGAAPGGSFSKLYDRYVAEKRYREKVSPMSLVQEICITLGQRGFPYLLSKDNINRQNNLKHERPVPCSNLCAEIIHPARCSSDAHDLKGYEYGVCNLATINLANVLVKDARATNGLRIDFAKLIELSGDVVCILDRMIDLNYDPTPECTKSNQRLRGIGIGVIGLADLFARLGMRFGSAEALKVDMAVHACIYFGATRQSSLLAEMSGSFPAYPGSEASKGTLQPDLWAENGNMPSSWERNVESATGDLLTPKHWEDLRDMLKTRGLRNAYVTATPPTATSSNGVGVNECVEPYTRNIYTRKTLAGQYIISNSQLESDLSKLKLWNRELVDKISNDMGSVANIEEIPKDIAELYPTARELDILAIPRHSAIRGGFITQSQSINHYRDHVDVKDVLTILLTSWRLGNTTISYYYHTAPASVVQKVRVESEAPKTKFVCTDDVCTSCAV